MNTLVTAPVLVVEDDPKIAQLLLGYLRTEGLPAQATGDGTAAVQLVRRLKPSLILLDLVLPGLDGLAVCLAVRAFSAVPVMMLTARVDELDRLLGLDSGADDTTALGHRRRPPGHPLAGPDTGVDGAGVQAAASLVEPAGARVLALATA